MPPASFTTRFTASSTDLCMGTVETNRAVQSVAELIATGGCRAEAAAAWMHHAQTPTHPEAATTSAFKRISETTPAHPKAATPSGPKRFSK